MYYRGKSGIISNMKSYHYSRNTVELDKTSIAELFQVLGINDPPDISKFTEINYPEDRTFYQLVAQVLTMNGISTIIAPNNWEPVNLFYQLKRVLKDSAIELSEEAENQEYEAYDISFKIDNATESITVDTADPSQLFNVVNKYLKGWEFVRLVSHLKERRSVEWLLVPTPFDTDKFKKLTGCTEMRADWEPSFNPRHTSGRIPTVSQVNPLAKKVFFLPSTFCFVDGEVKYFSYSNAAGNPMHWAGCVLPGQTFTEGIATELDNVLNYKGRFEFYNFKFLDYASDKEGNKIERYALSLKLLEPVIAAKTSTGLTVHLTNSPF